MNRKGVAEAARNALRSIAEELLERAKSAMDERIVTVESLESLPDRLIRTGWCGEEDCGHRIEEMTERDIIGTPVEDEGFKGMCVVCGKPTTTPVYIARAM